MSIWGPVCITTRIGGHPEPWFHNAWTALITRGIRAGDRVLPAPVKLPAHWAFDKVVKAFVEHPDLTHCESLLIVDDDMVFQPDALKRLRDNPEGQHCDILAALCRNRGDRMPLMFRLKEGCTWDDVRWTVPVEWQRGDVYQVDMTGFGFTLIRRRVLEAMGEPWAWYPAPGVTEDVAFFRRVAELGFTAAVDTGVGVDHITPCLIRAYPDPAAEVGQAKYPHVIPVPE